MTSERRTNAFPRPSPSFVMFDSRVRKASRSRSQNVANAAPRLIDSKPSAPLPANASSTTAPSNPPLAEDRAFMSDSRTLSVVGRVPDPFGAEIVRPRNSPEIILNCLFPSVHRTLKSCFGARLAPEQHAHFTGDSAVGGHFKKWILVKQCAGVFVGGLNDRLVSDHVDKLKYRRAVLAIA